MGRLVARNRGVCLLLALVACGGNKKTVVEPVAKPVAKPAPPPETEADREAKRHAAALEIAPEGSTCLPTALKDDGAPKLELASVNGEAVVCAIDTNPTRLLGVVGCWTVDPTKATVTYRTPAPLPGYSVDVSIDDGCARGFCLPKDSKGAKDKIAHMAWNLDGTKVAVLAGDEVHLFDAATKEHQSSFSIRGDKGLSNDPIAVYFSGDEIFVEGADQGPYSAVWEFKADGSQVGPLTAIGKDDRPLTTYKGSFSLLDKGRVGVAEHGFSTLTTFELATSKRVQLVRKIPKMVCKADELDAYWHDGDKISDKCKQQITKNFNHLIGATVVAGTKSLLVLLHGDRLGELGVLDPRTLAEKRAIKLPWCGSEPAAAGDTPKADKKSSSRLSGKADDAAAPSPAKPARPKKGSPSLSSDPDEGGD